jgi:hypothetical protein
MNAARIAASQDAKAALPAEQPERQGSPHFYVADCIKTVENPHVSKPLS